MARLRDSAVLALALAGCGKHHDDAPPAARSDGIPRTDTAIEIDGELREPAWNARALRGVLEDHGVQARPYSQIRLLHDDASLYVGLYAADENIGAADAWQLALGARTLRVDASGHTDAPDVRAGVDVDGTRDAPADFDEEWVIELAVPLASLGPPPLAISARRCDTPKDGIERCGAWQRTLALQ